MSNIGSLAMTGTFSKHPRAFGLPDDLVVEYGEGVHLMLSTGKGRKRVLDFVAGLGSNLLGYSNQEFINRVQTQVKFGAGFSLPHYLEREVADKLVHILGNRILGWSPDDISVRFAKTGSDATAMAVRLARAVTSKNVILHNGYSGWQSEFVAKTPPALGIPMDMRRYILDFSFNNETSILKYGVHGNIAAVMLEQGIEDPDGEWYPFLRDYCDDNSALLIMDEVVTGLRYAVGGASERYGVDPDLIVLGKALANGFPVSALVGRKEYMEWFDKTSPPFASSTHWGEAVGLAAADAVLDQWNDDYVDYIWDIGKRLMDGLNEIGWKTIGHPPRSLTIFNNDYEKAFFIQGMFAKGILMNRPNFISLAHTITNIEYALAMAKEIKDEFDKFPKDQLQKYMKPYLPHVLFKNR